MGQLVIFSLHKKPLDVIRDSSFHVIAITHSKRHWSNEQTMLQYIKEIIIPYVNCQRELIKDKKPAVVILDNFKAQIGPAIFLKYMYIYMSPSEHNRCFATIGRFSQQASKKSSSR